MKQIIRLTESDLHKIIKESVQRILREDGEDFISPLQRVKNNKPQPLGRIDNFNPNNGNIQVNGKWIPVQQAMKIARQELVNEIMKNGCSMNISAYDGEGYGTIEIETENGWYFIAEDIPVDLVIDSHAYYRPATWWDPEEYGDTEGHIENIDYQAQPFWCVPPTLDTTPTQLANKQHFDLKVDPELAKLLEQECNTDDIEDALIKMEEDYNDYQTGLYDDYINREIDMRRGN